MAVRMKEEGVWSWTMRKKDGGGWESYVGIGTARRLRRHKTGGTVHKIVTLTRSADLKFWPEKAGETEKTKVSNKRGSGRHRRFETYLVRLRQKTGCMITRAPTHPVF